MQRNKKTARQKAINKTGTSERFFYGFYFLGQLIFYTIIVDFLHLYMTDSGIPAVIVSGIFLVAKVWDAINDPIFGAIVDKTNMKSGKYIPWVRLSTFLIPAATIFLFAVPLDVSVQVKAIWCAGAYMLWDTSYTICDVPIFALATSMTDDLDERNRLYLLNRFFMIVGMLVVVIAVPLLYPSIGWLPTIIIMSVFAVATMLPIGYRAKERFFSDEQRNPKIRELVRYFFNNKPLLVFNAAMIISSITNTTTAVQGYAAIHGLGGAEWISILAGLGVLPMLASVVVTQQIIKKIEKRTVFLFCNMVGYLLGVALYFVGYGNIVPFVVLVVLRAAFLNVGTVLIVIFTADCAEYGNYKTGERAQGVAFSVQTFTAKITGALSGAIGMALLGLFGFKEGDGVAQTPETVEWIWRMFSFFPIISGAVAFFIMLFGYKLYSKDVALMTRYNAGEISREEAEAGFSKRY